MTDPARRRRLWIRLYSRLLVLFPAEFCTQYREEMIVTFERSLSRAAGRGGYWAELRYALAAAGDIPGAAWRVRRARARQHQRPTKQRRRLLATVAFDLRQGWRGLMRTRGMTVAALIILVLGIGGTTATFSVLNAVLLRPLPYAEPDRLATLWTVNTAQNLPDGSSYLNYADWKRQSRTFADMTMYIRPEFTYYTLMESERPERIHVGMVMDNFFDVLGVTAIHGRTFQARDLEEDLDIVVISESFWRSRYDASPDVLGRSLRVRGDDLRIVGVVPAFTEIPLRVTDVWELHDPRPDSASARFRRWDSHVVLGRLVPEATVAEARTELRAIAARLALEYPESNANLSVDVRPLLTEIVGERLPRILWMLFGAVALVLLVTCTNVAHLMLARGERRRREFAIRATLGAGRSRLLRQVMVENVMLAVAAGTAGVAVAVIGLDTLLRLAPPDVPRLDTVTIDPRVLGLALIATVLAGPVFGLVPAVASSRQDPGEALKVGSRTVSGGHRRLRRGLVVAQVAMAVVLLAHAGLLARTISALTTLDPGFDAESILLAQVDLDPDDYPDAQARDQFYREVVRELETLPGVESVGVIGDFFIRRIPDVRVFPTDRPPADLAAPAPPLTADQVGPGFFAALGVPLLAGREFEDRDLEADANRVIVVNRAAAETFWPGRSPVGEQFRWSPRVDGAVYTVIGVVPDFRRTALDEAPYPNMFLPGYSYGMDLAVRTSGDPTVLGAAVRRAVQTLDPTVPVSRVASAEARLEQTMGSRRFQTVLLGLFAALTILLAAVGLYALLHDLVASRRREIGVRVALGADPTTVRALVWRHAFVLVAIGLGLGLIGSLAAGRLTAAMLYEVTASDPVTLGFVGLVLLGVTLAASWLPARRATRVQPVEVLAEE